MKPNFSTVFALILGCNAFPVLAFAETVAIMPVSGVNVHQAYQQIAQDLIKDHLVATGKYGVVLVPGEPPAKEASMDVLLAAGKAVGADLVMQSHLTHLQTTFRLRITVYRLSTKGIVHSDSLSTTGGPDQLDPIIQRLMQGFATGQRAIGNAEIDNVTQQESDPYMKQTATRTFGLKLGGILPFNRPAGDVAMGPSLGIFWLYDAREYMAEAFVDFVISGNENDPDTVNAFNIGIGLYRPFSRKNLAPYAGGGMAYSVSNFGGAGANGLRLHGVLGVLFGRLSTVQIRGEIGYFMNTYRERLYDTYELSAPPLGSAGSVDNPKSLSHGPLLTAGIGF